MSECVKCMDENAGRDDVWGRRRLLCIHVSIYSMYGVCCPALRLRFDCWEGGAYRNLRSFLCRMVFLQNLCTHNPLPSPHAPEMEIEMGKKLVDVL